ncbi:Crp/Fnr family transcriptional regulator [Massilia sp. S19_KUP03_FR1]|uniref:Crp/Fnr family transcriptional regulator n=1 Tax=Massilia sp. S19_KUP03_FR1 TaxID=3025503 RepID=UPI002FCDCFBA
MYSPLNPLKNRLLAELDRAEFYRLSPFLELISLAHGDVLYQAGGKMVYVYFPVTATISIDCLLEDGGTSEITRIGNEGMLGVTLFMGGQRSNGRAAVQAAGYAYRLSAARLMEEFYHKGPLLRLLLRYTQARLMQVSQLAACNSHHTTKQRLCRYLLQMLDRSSSNEMTVTQEEIGAIIGVRREGVTDAARWLQQLGIISWRRGRVTILSRAGLLEHVCECYAVVNQSTAQLLPELNAVPPAMQNAWRTSGALPPFHFSADERRTPPHNIYSRDAGEDQAELAFS